MLTPKERAQLLKLKEREKELHIPLTDTELKELEKRTAKYLTASIGWQIPSIADFMKELGAWSLKVSTDNMRLIQEVHYYRNKYGEQNVMRGIRKKAVDSAKKILGAKRKTEKLNEPKE